VERADFVVVGAGVIGLAIAGKLAGSNKDIIVVEKHPSFGRETSSRNSEVIHAGIYYSEDSLRAKLCVEGKRLLYEFCRKYNVPHRKLGKLIVATDEKESDILEELLQKGKNNGVDDLSLLTEKELKRTEPNVRAVSALYSPSTGIIDTHSLMKRLESSAQDKGVVFAYGCEVTNVEKKDDGYLVSIRDADGEDLSLSTETFINSAGLCSDKIAEMVGMDIDKLGYRLHYSKGEYFRVEDKKAKLLRRLVYPAPHERSLGIHTVSDLQGQLKLGPNAFDVDEINYDVDPSHADEFYESVKEFLPFIEKEDLSPDMAGIRSELLKVSGEEDFIILDEEKNGFPHFINLIGIKSPGLTASLAIAKYVDAMI